ncbi:MAG: TSUP family transporter [Bdellovibrionota bacterium]
MLVNIYCALVIVVAFVGEAVFGFGGGLLSVPLLSLAIDVRDAVVLASIFQCILAVLVLTNWRDVAWSLVKPVLVGVVVGVVIGSCALTFLNLNALRLLLAAFILAFLAKTILFPDVSVTTPGLAAGTLSGILLGFFQGCIGAGGPNLVLYLNQIVPGQRQFRATMICALSVASIIRMPFFASAELFTTSVRSIALPIVPLFLIGMIAGQQAHHRVPSALYFRVVYLFLLVSALCLIWRSLPA